MTNFSVSTIDYHTAGEPFRIVANPPVAIEGDTVAERCGRWSSCERRVTSGTFSLDGGTREHDDHISVAPQLVRTCMRPVLLHPGDEVLWRGQSSGRSVLADGQRIALAGTEIRR